MKFDGLATLNNWSVFAFRSVSCTKSADKTVQVLQSDSPSHGCSLSLAVRALGRCELSEGIRSPFLSLHDIRRWNIRRGICWDYLPSRRIFPMPFMSSSISESPSPQMPSSLVLFNTSGLIRIRSVFMVPPRPTLSVSRADRSSGTVTRIQ